MTDGLAGRQISSPVIGFLPSKQDIHVQEEGRCQTECAVARRVGYCVTCNK